MFSYDKKKKSLNVSIFKLKLHISIDLEKIIIKNFRFLILLLDLILPKNDKKIVFNSYPNYSDNSYAYYQYLVQNYKDKYKYIWITLDTFKDTDLKIDGCDLYTFKAIYHLITSKYIVSTHAGRFISFFCSKKHAYLNLWHGMPIKTLGYAERHKDKNICKKYDFVADKSYMFATSDLFKNLFISCFKIDFDKVFITGHAKNDLIFSTKNDSRIKEWLNLDEYDKVMFYLPTYKFKTGVRGKQINKEFNNIFYFDDYNNDDFNTYLKENKILFIIKPHPMDEDFYKQYFSKQINNENIKVVYNETFIQNDFNMYEIFKFVDVMVSDFSSVTIDYLILNRPVIYLDNISEDYQKERGTVLEDNYDILMPGAKVKTYEELKSEMNASKISDKYVDLRNQNMPLIHKYLDGNTCERIYEIMKGL